MKDDATSPYCIKTETSNIAIFLYIWCVCDYNYLRFSQDLSCCDGHICRMLWDETCHQDQKRHIIMRKWLNHRATTVLGLFMYFHDNSSWVLYSHSVDIFFPLIYDKKTFCFKYRFTEVFFFSSFQFVTLLRNLVDFKTLGLLQVPLIIKMRIMNWAEKATVFTEDTSCTIAKLKQGKERCAFRKGGV